MHNFDGLDEINLNKTEEDVNKHNTASPVKNGIPPAYLDGEIPEKEPAIVAPFSSESTLEESVPKTIVKSKLSREENSLESEERSKLLLQGETKICDLRSY